MQFTTIKFQILLGLTFLSVPLVHAQERPNIVIILTDDQGYADISRNPNSKSYVQTPHMDALANEGIFFNQAYISGNTCSPTRAGLMTGRYQHRNGIYDSGEGGSGMPLSEILFPDFIKPAGYVSAAFGKWHLGLTPEYNPVSRGFDEFYGFMGRGAHDYFNLEDTESPMYRGLNIITESEGYLTNLLTDEAVAFIEREKDNPFFCYVAYNAVHSPAQAPQEDIDAFIAEHGDTGTVKRNTLMAMLNILDDGVGKIVKTLKDNDIWDNTIFIFLTDNGGSSAMEADCGLLRGNKQLNYEGGIRTPFVFSWPAKYPAQPNTQDPDKDFIDRTIDTPIISLDLIPTVMDALDLPLPTEKPFDGKSILPIIDGTATGHHDKLYWTEGGNEGEWAIRREDWKLVGTEDKLELFDLEADPYELNNLTSSEPELVLDLVTEFNEWLAEMPKPNQQSAKQWAPEIAEGQILTLYRDLYYGGRKQSFANPGEVLSSDLSVVGNNIARSIQVAKGYKAIIYTEDNFYGERIEITSDTPFLGNFDQKVSSIYIVETTGIDGKNIVVTDRLGTSSDELKVLFDSDYKTTWPSVGREEWIQFEWCEPEVLKGIEIAFRIVSEKRVYSFDIESSLDGSNWTRLISKGENQGTNSGMEYFSFPETEAKFLRIYAKGNETNKKNEYTEIRFDYAVSEHVNKIEVENYATTSSAVGRVPTTDCAGLFDVEIDENNVELGYDLEFTAAITSLSLRMKPLKTYTVQFSMDGGNSYLPQEISVSAEHVNKGYQTFTAAIDIPKHTNNLTLKISSSSASGGEMITAMNTLFYTVDSGGLGFGPIKEEGFSFYPTLVDESLNLTSSQPLQRVRVYDLLGRLLLSKSLAASRETVLNLSSLKTGTYLLVVNNQSEMFYKK